MMVKILAALIVSFVGLCVGAQGELVLEDRPQLFVDHHFVESLEGEARLKLWEPRGGEAVLDFDKPWEGRYCGYATVLKDGDRYRMYYRGLPEAGKDGSDTETTCYAESDDGIHWVKPNLGIHVIDGSTDNNVILKDGAPFSHNFSPFIDTRPGVDDLERFKAIAGTHASKLATFVSGDGIHWSKKTDAIITEGAFDSQNVAFWSESEQQYLCYFRVWSQGVFKGYRSIARSTSPDFETWSEPIEMTYSDTPREHLYTNQTQPYFRDPSLYVAIAARFMPGRRVVDAETFEAIGGQASYSGDCSDTVLMTSRGGTSYQRTFMEGFVRPGLGLNNWSSRTNYPALGLVPTGPEEMSFYIQRNYGQTSHHLQRMVLRTDGFASVRGAYSGGVLHTKPFVLKGDELVLNFATSAAGAIRVELRTEDGERLPGFTRGKCDEILGDQIERVVKWGGESDLSPLKGETIRMSVYLNDADLFSIRARDAQGAER
jgi:hypothetical protein